jgi:hypothetical protein
MQTSVGTTLPTIAARDMHSGQSLFTPRGGSVRGGERVSLHACMDPFILGSLVHRNVATERSQLNISC